MNLGAPPPDAGDTYLGAYGFQNVWCAWLVGRAPELVAERATRLWRGAPAPPVCPRSPLREPHDMVLRPGEWVCYRHETPVRVRIRPRYPRAPRTDALAHLGDMLER